MMGFVVFLFVWLALLVPTSLAADRWSARATFDDAQRARIDFGLLALNCVVVWLGAATLL